MQKTNTKNLVLAALFAALTAVFSQIIVPLPFTPVPLSANLIAVFLTGALLNKKTAFFSQVAYVLLGAVGAPVFSAFSGGLHKIAGPTGGYILAYPLMAVIVAFAAEKWGRSFWKMAGAMAVSLVVCYAIGTVQLMLITKADLLSGLTMAVFPFIPLDLAKCLLTAGFALALSRALAHGGRGVARVAGK